MRTTKMVLLGAAALAVLLMTAEARADRRGDDPYGKYERSSRRGGSDRHGDSDKYGRHDRYDRYDRHDVDRSRGLTIRGSWGSIRFGTGGYTDYTHRGSAAHPAGCSCGHCGTSHASRGRWETRTVAVLVEPGRWDYQTIPARYEWRTGPRGHRYVVCVQPARVERVWIPPRYEYQTQRVWVQH